MSLPTASSGSSGQQQQQQQQQQQLEGSSASPGASRIVRPDDDATDDIDQQFAMKESCVENAFKRAKQWSDYVREVCISVETMCKYSVEYHQRMGENMNSLMQVLKSESSSSLPLQSYYMTGANIIQQDCQASEQIFRASIPQIVYEALRSRIKEHENARKRFKIEWSSIVRQWRKAYNAMEQCRQTYYQRCTEVERAHSDYVSTNTKTTSLVLVSAPSGQSTGGGTTQLRGDPKHEAKLSRKKKYEEDCVTKREAARRAYLKSVEELNSVTDQRERKKVEILRSVRELIERGDQCFITATCGFFECYTRTKESNNQELRSLSKNSHQNYRPGSKYREFARTCISLDADDPPPRFSFEEFNTASRLTVTRKESRGGSSGDGGIGGGIDDDPEIEEDEESGENIVSSSYAVATSKSPGLAGRIWTSTRDTATSFFQKPTLSIKFKKPASAGHLQLEQPGGGGHSPRMDIGQHVGIICRCIQVIDEIGIRTNGIYRIQASKRRVLDLSQLLEADPDTHEVELYEESPHTVCGLLKYHLMQLPDALLTADLYTAFIEAGKDGADVSKLASLVGQLPKLNRLLAGALFHHLNRVAAHESENQMNSQNLSLVFAPTVLRPKQESQANTASLSEVLDYSHQKIVAQALIDRVTEIFGPASEYSTQEFLPSPSPSRSQGYEESVSSAESGLASAGIEVPTTAGGSSTATTVLTMVPTIAATSGPSVPTAVSTASASATVTATAPSPSPAAGRHRAGLPAAFDPGVEFDDIDDTTEDDGTSGVAGSSAKHPQTRLGVGGGSQARSASPSRRANKTDATDARRSREINK
ncbi:hypothetical protein BOX15_Mlig010895g1 [Macrostomum lignano]|uniref:Rho-GAP domain-containing protein n=1 Tax=Macrostomum lignano TaxID=282301 RepID=A0A267FPR2_9PLAT|nr:hypothetical protein BOX15_Mlig010895g1 [Macrostomum lignano]